MRPDPLLRPEGRRRPIHRHEWLDQLGRRPQHSQAHRPGQCVPKYACRRLAEHVPSEIKDFIAPVSLSFANCGAITVSKTAKHAAGGAADHPQAGVSFTIGSTTQQTGSDRTTCFSGLALRQTYTVTETVPSGYVSDDDLKGAQIRFMRRCTSQTANRVNAPHRIRLLLAVALHTASAELEAEPSGALIIH